MKYNKFEIHKTKEHKILRKVKKNWIVISLSFFSFVGGGMLIDDGTNVHADTINNNDSSSDSMTSSVSTNSSAAASMATSATSIGTNSYASVNSNNTYSNNSSVTSSSTNVSSDGISAISASTNVSSDSSSSSSTSTNISNTDSNIPSESVSILSSNSNISSSSINISSDNSNMPSVSMNASKNNSNMSSASLSGIGNNSSSTPTSTDASSNNISATSISTDASSNNSNSSSASTLESSNDSSSMTSSSTSTSSYDSHSSSASMDSSNNNSLSPSYSANDGTGIQNIDDFDWAINRGEANDVDAKDAGDWAKKIDPMGAQWLPIIQQYVNNGNYIVIPQEHIEDAEKLFNSYVKDNNLSGDYINYENHPYDNNDFSVKGFATNPAIQSEDGLKNVAELTEYYNSVDTFYDDTQQYLPTDSLQLNKIIVPIDFGNGGEKGAFVGSPSDNDDSITNDFQKISTYAGHYQAPIYMIIMKDLTHTVDEYSTARANGDNNENDSAYYNYDGQATAGIPLDYMIYLHPQVYNKDGKLITSDLTKSAPVVNIHYLDINNNNKQVGTQDIFAVPNTKLNNYLLTPTPGYQIQDLNGYINVTDSEKDYGVNVIKADSSAVSNNSESSSTSSSTASTSNNSAVNSFIYNSENSSERASAASQATSSDSSSTSSLSSEISRDPATNSSAVDSSTYNSERASAASQAASSDSTVASSAAAVGNNNLSSSASDAAGSEDSDSSIFLSETSLNYDNSNFISNSASPYEDLSPEDDGVMESLKKVGEDIDKLISEKLKLYEKYGVDSQGNRMLPDGYVITKDTPVVIKSAELEVLSVLSKTTKILKVLSYMQIVGDIFGLIWNLATNTKVNIHWNYAKVNMGPKVIQSVVKLAKDGVNFYVLSTILGVINTSLQTAEDSSMGSVVPFAGTVAGSWVGLGVGIASSFYLAYKLSGFISRVTNEDTEDLGIDDSDIVKNGVSFNLDYPTTMAFNLGFYLGKNLAKGIESYT